MVDTTTDDDDVVVATYTGYRRRARANLALLPGTRHA